MFDDWKNVEEGLRPSNRIIALIPVTKLWNWFKARKEKKDEKKDNGDSGGSGNSLIDRFRMR